MSQDTHVKIKRECATIFKSGLCVYSGVQMFKNAQTISGNIPVNKWETEC